MKNLFLALIATAVTLPAMAQHKKHDRHQGKHHARARQMLGKALHIQAMRNMPAAKPTAVSQRVIGQAVYLDPFTSVSDSFAFKYSGGRGSVFMPELMTFTPYYNGSSFDHFYDLFGYDNYYGTSLLRNEAPVVKSDTTFMYSTLWASTPTFGLLATESHTYDAADNLLDNTLIGDTTYYSQRDSMTYNADGSIATAYEYSWIDFPPTPPYWNLGNASHFSYDGAGRMVADSQSINSGGWVPQVKYTYSYDAAGNMVLAQRWAWDFPGHVLTNSFVMTYDGTGRLQTYRYYNHDGATPELEVYDSVGYTAGVPYPTYFRIKEYSTGSLMWMDVLTKNMAASGKPDTMTYLSYDEDSTTVMGSGLAALVYNSYANPVTMTVYYDDFSATPTTLEQKIYYYYENYGTAWVNDAVTAKPAKMNVYPNPATAVLTVRLSGASINEPVELMLADITGRTIKTETIKQGTAGTLSLQLADVPAGIYVLSAIQNGHILAREKVVKQ